jgi:hypothetical protein
VGFKLEILVVIGIDCIDSCQSNYHPITTCYILWLLQVQVPFDTYFKVSPLAMYHKVMTMELFMMEVALYVWPVGERTGKVVFCQA